jgi:hypothetical protein
MLMPTLGTNIAGKVLAINHLCITVVHGSEHVFSLFYGRLYTSECIKVIAMEFYNISCNITMSVICSASCSKCCQNLEIG